MSFAGIIAGAFGGGAQSLANISQADIDQQNKLDLASQLNQLSLQKEQALEQMRVQIANQQRQAMVQRIGDARQGIVGNMLANKYAGSDAAVAAANAGQTDAPLTPDQQAVIDQSKSIDQTALQNSPSTYVKAAMQTGDIDPKTVALTDERLNAAEARADAMERVAGTRAGASMYGADQRLTGTKYGADSRLQGVEDNAASRSADSRARDASRSRIALQAITAKRQIAAAKMGSLGSGDQATAHQLVSIAKDIDQFSKDVRSMQNNLIAQTGPEKQQALTEIAAKKQRIEQLMSQEQDLRNKASSAARDAAQTTTEANRMSGAGAAGVGAALDKFNSMMGN